MEEWGVEVWGVADLGGVATPTGETGEGFPFALAWAIPIDPRVMESGVQTVFPPRNVVTKTACDALHGDPGPALRLPAIG
jgi:hypothetical protein